MFQVGKHYKNKCLPSALIRTCVYSGNRIAVFKDDNDTEVALDQTAFVMYEEYIPPKKGTLWVNVYSDGFTNVNTTKEEADYRRYSNNYARIACIEVPWIEGQGL